MATENMPRHWYEDYERGRPGYPDRVADLGELAPSATVLELAAGTGKFTSQLTSRFANVVAVEPDPGMRRLLVAGCPGVEAIDGTAEQIPLAHDAVDAVFVAQAFHWFDNEAALVEIVAERYLVPSDSNDTVEAVLSEPRGMAEPNWLFFVTISLVWAGRALDYIDPDRERRSQLMRAARETGVAPDLHLTHEAQRRIAAAARERKRTRTVGGQP